MRRDVNNTKFDVVRSNGKYLNRKNRHARASTVTSEQMNNGRISDCSDRRLELLVHYWVDGLSLYLSNRNYGVFSCFVELSKIFVLVRPDSKPEMF
jgi:hypothetical protein